MGIDWRAHDKHMPVRPLSTASHIQLYTGPDLESTICSRNEFVILIEVEGIMVCNCDDTYTRMTRPRNKSSGINVAFFTITALYRFSMTVQVNQHRIAPISAHQGNHVANCTPQYC